MTQRHAESYNGFEIVVKVLQPTTAVYGYLALLSSVVDLLIASTLAVADIAMTPLPAWVVAGTLAVDAIFAVFLDLVKAPVFQRLKIT